MMLVFRMFQQELTNLLPRGGGHSFPEEKYISALLVQVREIHIKVEWFINLTRNPLSPRTAQAAGRPSAGEDEAELSGV